MQRNRASFYNDLKSFEDNTSSQLALDIDFGKDLPKIVCDKPLTNAAIEDGCYPFRL
jgi:hypothetical protein